MAVKTVYTCDLCESSGEYESYRLATASYRSEETKETYHVCPKHRKEVESYGIPTKKVKHEDLNYEG